VGQAVAIRVACAGDYDRIVAVAVAVAGDWWGRPVWSFTPRWVSLPHSG